MSLSAETRLVQYTLSGSGQVLPVTFKFFAAADLKVTKTVAGVDTVLVVTTNYTVSGGGTPAATGNVTMVAGTAGDVITIEGAATQTQGTDLTTGGPFPSASLTAQIDRLTMLVQQLKLQTDRAVRVPNTNATLAALTVAARAGKLVYFDDTGAMVMLALADLIEELIAAGLEVTVSGGSTTALNSREDLAAVEVVAGDLDAVRPVVVDGAGEFWQLVAGTDADDPTNGVIRPVNYDGSTNAFVWKLIL